MSANTSDEASGGPGVVAAPDSQPPRKRRHHRILVSILLVLGTLLTPLAITTLYIKTEITDTGRYVQTVKPLASDPAVQAYIATSITNNLFDQVDVQSYVKNVLPTRADPLAGPITGALRNFTYDAVLRVVQSNQFQTIWTETNRAAHSLLVKVLTGEGSAVVSTKNGAVTVDLAALADKVKAQLESTVISACSKIPTDRIAGKVTIFESNDLYRVRHAVGLMDRMAIILPLLVLLCFAGAIFLSANRRRGFVRAAIAFTLGGVILAVTLSIGRTVYLDGAVKQGIPRDAAAAIFDNLVRLMHTSLRAVLAFSIVVVIAAIASGPSRAAVGCRRVAKRSASWLGGESDRAGWAVFHASAFVRREQRWFRIVIAAVGFAVLVAWDRPTSRVILGISLVTLLALAIVEFYAREPTEPAITIPEEAPATDIPATSGP